MYKSYKDIENKVNKLVENKELRRELGKNAYNYITNEWTAKVATNNLLKLFESIINGEKFDIEDGPASKAEK